MAAAAALAEPPTLPGQAATAVAAALELPPMACTPPGSPQGTTARSKDQLPGAKRRQSFTDSLGLDFKGMAAVGHWIQRAAADGIAAIQEASGGPLFEFDRGLPRGPGAAKGGGRRSSAPNAPKQAGVYAGARKEAVTALRRAEGDGATQSTNALAVAMRQRGGIKREAKATCPSGHPLENVGLTRDNGWACDGRLLPGGCRSGLTDWHQSKGMPRFRCSTCDFDLCALCAQAPEVVLAGSLRGAERPPVGVFAAAMAASPGRASLCTSSGGLKAPFGLASVPSPARRRTLSAADVRRPAVGGGSATGRPPMPEAPAKGDSPRGKHFFGEFRDFLHRGGTLPPTPTRSHREPSQLEPLPWPGGQGAAAVDSALRHRFAAWSSSRSLVAEQARLTSLHWWQPAQPLVDSLGLDCATFLEAAFVFDGVEVLARLAVLEQEARALVLGAESRCRWPLVQRAVASAASLTTGRPLEELLEALAKGFGLEQPPSPRGGEASPARRSSTEEDGSSLPGTPRSRADIDGGLGVSTSAPGLAASFADWCRSRPPLLRFQHASTGMGWDFPLSKAEKHELLLLQVFSQEADRHSEIKGQARRRRASHAPSSCG